MNTLRRFAALLLAVAGAFESWFFPPSSGQECLANKACNPGAIALSDNADAEKKALIIFPEVTSGTLPPITMTLKLEPGWTDAETGASIITKTVDRLPGHYPSSLPFVLPVPRQLAKAWRPDRPTDVLSW
jgi:hypothetical protein